MDVIASPSLRVPDGTQGYGQHGVVKSVSSARQVGFTVQGDSRCYELIKRRSVRVITEVGTFPDNHGSVGQCGGCQRLLETCRKSFTIFNVHVINQGHSLMPCSRKGDGQLCDSINQLCWATPLRVKLGTYE